MDFMNFLTPDQTLSNIEKIEQIFPSAITEMRDENGNLKKGDQFRNAEAATFVGCSGWCGML